MLLNALSPAVLGAATLAAALVVKPGAALAADRRTLADAVSVRPGATCIDARSLLEQVESWVGAGDVDADLAIEVRGDPARPRTVEFQVLRAGRVIAERRFDPGPARCEQLHAVVGLAIAMAIKASLVEELVPAPRSVGPVAPPESAGGTGAALPPSAGPAPVASVEAPAEAPTRIGTAPATRPAMPSPSTERGWGLAVDAMVALALLLDPAYGVGLRVDRSIAPPFDLRLGFNAFASLGEQFGGTTGHFDSSLVAARVDGCAGGAPLHRLWIHGCLGFAGGALLAQGFGYPSTRSAVVRWLAFANELGVALDLGRRWSVEASATVYLPALKTAIVLRDYSGNVLSEGDLSNIGWALGIGPKVRF